ncbi:MAG: hypothetical protein ABSG65_11200 [Bryobacteraceae bacterium]|jgi:hypothetical protein
MVRGFLAKRIVVSLIMACALAHGQAKPDLNGVWKMNPEKSDFGSGPVSASRMDTISLEGVNLKDTITQKLQRGPESTYDMIYTLDGKECTNHVRGNLVKSTAKWEGEELVIDSKVFALREADIQDRWTLSGDGKTITLRRHMTGAITAEQKLLFDRQ